MAMILRLRKKFMAETECDLLKNRKLVEVHKTTSKLIELQVICSILEENNIPCMVSEESAEHLYGITVNGLAEKRILVNEENADNAKKIIKDILEGM